MLFDWFTLIAQLVNFLILVWLLKRFLYKPILNAIEEREKLIANQLNDAEESKANANKELENYQQKNAVFDQQRQELFNNAITEVNAERQKLLEQTRSEVEALRQRLQESLRTEQQNLSSEIIRRTSSEVFAIARKTLADLASINLEDQMVSVFVNRLNSFKSEEKELLRSAFKQSSSGILIRSTFDLPAEQKSAIQSAIRNNIDLSPQMKFEITPHLISGIELITNGYKISWTIDDYLISLENHIADLLNDKSNITTERMP